MAAMTSSANAPFTWLSEVGLPTKRSEHPARVKAKNSRAEFKNEMSDLVGFES